MIETLRMEIFTLAPTQNEPPFATAPIVVLGLFLRLGAQAVRKFRTESQPVSGS